MQGDNVAELNQWAPQVYNKLRTVAELADVNSDQQTHGLRASLVIDRETASRLGITPQMIDNTLYDAFGQRFVSTMYTQLNQYHVVMEVDPQFWQSPDGLQYIFVRANNGSQVPLSVFTHYEATTAPLAINHQGPFPSVTISFNLPPGVALGDAVTAIGAAEREIGLPSAIRGSFQGTAQAYQDSLASEPLLIAAALLTVYIVLGVLYESYIHPLTILSTLPSAGVGALLALMLCHTELSVIALIGIILLDRHREEERDHDDRLRARGRAQGREVAGGGHLPGLPAALPADHDDDDGGAAWRVAAGDRLRHRVRAAPAAGHRHRRRAVVQPDADALHDAGRLSVSRSRPAVVGPPPRVASSSRGARRRRRRRATLGPRRQCLGESRTCRRH